MDGFDALADAALADAAAATAHPLLGMLATLCWRCGAFLTVVSTVAAAALYVKQDSLLYFPTVQGVSRRPSENPRRYRSPSEHGVPHETHVIPCADGVRLHSWLLYHPDAKSQRLPTILFFHGNAGNIGLRIPNALAMHQYLRANVWLVEYRGYGDSDDVTPDEKGLKLDAEAALRYAHSDAGSHVRHVDRGRIFVFGRSLGGAVAFHAADYARTAGLPLAGIIAENTFTSISDMVDHLLPLVAPIKGLLLRIGWDSARVARKLGGVPVLLLAGAKDALVPHSCMKKLFRLCRRASSEVVDAEGGSDGGLVRMHVVEDGTHNETWMQGGKEYWRAIQQFLADVSEAEERSLRWGSGRRLGGASAGGAGGVSAEARLGGGGGGGCDAEDPSEVSSGSFDGAGAAASSIPTVGGIVGMAREATRSTVAGVGLKRSGSTHTDPYKKTE